MLKEYPISDIKNIKINGRTKISENTLPLFWTASGFEINVKACELWVETEADYESQEPWFSILIDGDLVSRQMAYKGQNKVCLFRGRNGETVHNVRFIKDSQAQSGDDKCVLIIHSLITDGTFEEVKDRPYKIEVIGDSLTSGEGLYGAQSEMDWVAQLFSGTRSYAFQLAEKINADLRVISQSGWGLFTSWDGHTECAIPPYYEQICGLLNGERNLSLGANEKYDFSTWQPDAVIINLGTNDATGYKTDNFNHEISEFITTGIEFLKTIRKNNPKAKIIWAYGMLGYEFGSHIQKVIDDYMLETNDTIAYVKLPPVTDDLLGSRCHPGKGSHALAAQTLESHLK